MTASAVIPYAEAVRRAGALKAAADLERDQLAMTGGPEAVARAAHRPGGPPVSEIEALYIRLQDASRQARAA